MTHICVSKLTIIGSDNGLSPWWRQAIIWTNDGILLIRTLGTNFSEILSEIHSFSFKKMHLKMSSAKWRLFCLGLNELTVENLLFVYFSRYMDLSLNYCEWIVLSVLTSISNVTHLAILRINVYPWRQYDVIFIALPWTFFMVAVV